jgi:multidrug efflux pump subunit AcrA (membrane-fusion protein)
VWVVQDMTQLALNFTGSGTVTHLYVTAGQCVRVGQLLATMSDPARQNEEALAAQGRRDA